MINNLYLYMVFVKTTGFVCGAMYRKKQQTVQQVRNPTGLQQMSWPSTSMHGQGVELGATEKQLQLVTRVGFESRVKEFNSRKVLKNLTKALSRQGK